MADFRDKLNASVSRSNSRGSKDLKVINMQSPKNQGSVIFVPITGIDGSDAIAVLENVLEVKDYFKYKDKDQVEQTGTRWLKLLDRSDYPELTSEEKDIYKSIRAKAKTMLSHVFNKDKRKNADQMKNIIRVKNYTAIMGYIVEHRDLKDKMINQKMPAILVFSSARFDESLNKALLAKDKSTGGSEWQAKLFNRDKLRKQFLLLSYYLSDDPKKIGYITSVTIEKFDEDTIRLTDGKADGLHMDDDKSQEMLKSMTNTTFIFAGVKHGERLFKDEYMTNLTVRINKILNKYCGTDLPTGGADSVDPDTKETASNLPPENSKVENPDVWKEAEE